MVLQPLPTLSAPHVWLVSGAEPLARCQQAPTRLLFLSAQDHDKNTHLDAHKKARRSEISSYPILWRFLPPDRILKRQADGKHRLASLMVSIILLFATW